MAATKALAGMVKIQAQTMLPATPTHRAGALRGAHADDGTGDGVRGGDRNAQRGGQEQVNAPPVSAQKPPTGLSLVIFCPMV